MPKFDQPSTFRPASHLAAMFVVGLFGLLVTESTVTAQPTGDDAKPAADRSGTSSKQTADSDATPDGTSQQTTTTAWIIQRSTLAQTRLSQFQQGLRDALGTHGGRHLVGKSDLTARVAARPATVPSCLFGVESCGSAITVALDHLNIGTLVRMEVDVADDAGASETVRARYTLIDRTGEPRRSADVSAQGARNLAFAIVRDIFDATATLKVVSTPEGADVFLDDERIGATPLEQRVSIGRHSYRVELADHEPASGDIELSADSTERIEASLAPKPAQLQVQGAPDNAEIVIDGELRGPATDTATLEPGSHTLVVRAEGYAPLERQFDAKPGESLQITAPLERESPWLKDIAAESIASNRYILRVSGGLGLHPTTYRDARTQIPDGQLEFAGFLNDSDNRPIAEPVRRTAVPVSIQADFGYSWRNIGLLVGSMSYSGASMNRQAELIRRTDTRETVTATVEGVRRFQLRPIQVRYRHFFKNFVPTVEAGTGISFQWVSVRPNDTDEREILHHTEAFWTVGIGAQYFFTPRIFVLGRYNFQDFFNTGRGVEHMLNIGAGMTFPDLFGFEPRPPEQLE